MTFVRTVLGDIDPGALGVTYAHEHVVIDGGRPVLMEPDFDLGDVDAMATEVAEATAKGLSAVVDAMPCDAGRSALKLAELSAPGRDPRHRADRPASRPLLRSGPLERPAPGRGDRDPVRPRRHRRHRSERLQRSGRRANRPSRWGDQDRRQCRWTVGPRSTRLRSRRARPSRDRCADPDPLRGRDRRPRAARVLTDHGVAPEHIALSHVDKVVDRGYHRELLGSGAFGEYDQSFRWRRRRNGTLQLLEWAVEDGLDGQVLLGMDAARRGYYHVYDGAPGLSWLLDGFTALMVERGLDETVRHRLFVDGTGEGVRLRGPGDRGGRRVTDRLADQRGRLARATVVVRVGHRCGRPRRVRPGGPVRDARRRGGPRDPRPGGSRHRHRLRRRDASSRVLHGRVLQAPDRRAAAAVAAPAGCRRPRPAAPLRGPRADRGTGRPRRRRGVPVRRGRARRGRSR